MNPKDKAVELRKIRNRIDWLSMSKVNAFSPTISPAPKSIERNEIESLYEGLRYYVNRGVKDIVVQKKYMGSYCDIYLHRDIDETYFVSRNGYRIEHINLTEAKLACEELHQGFDWTELELVIIQAELMPWKVLGKGLIEKEYDAYADAHSVRLGYLQSSGLYDKIQSLQTSEAFITFQEDEKSLSGNKFREKYPSHVVRQYLTLGKFELEDLPVYEKELFVFEKEVNHFGVEAPISFKPFNILKKVYRDGTEEIPNSNLTYNEVNPDEMKVLHFESDADIEAAMEGLDAWFDSLTDNMEEGVVIKPVTTFIPGLPPALKVRNSQYLTMI